MSAAPARPPVVEPPLDAERSVLAAMMLDPEAIGQACELLKPDAFHHDSHKKIFAAILDLYQRGDRADVITVSDELRRRGDLDVVGGQSTVAGIMELATTSANLEEHARIVSEAASKRQLCDFAINMQAMAEDPTASVAAILAHFEAAARDFDGAADGARRFADAALDASDFAALDIPKPRSLLGDGVLVAGGFGIIYGKPGSGKTWIGLGLGCALVRGEPWMSLTTHPEGVRVGIVQLELGAHAMQTRMHALGIGTYERDRALRLACRPRLRGIVDLFRQPGDLAALREWIRRDRLDVVVIDALSRAHTANENKAEELGQVLAMLDALRHETGCAIILVHHEPKEREGGDHTNHLDALRGTSRLQSDPTLLVRIHRSRGLHCLTFAKVSEGPTPEDIYFRICESGRPEVVEPPEARGDHNWERVLNAVLSAAQPVARAEVQKVTGLGRSAVAGHLKALVGKGRIAKFGKNREARYAAPTVRPSEPSGHQTPDGQPSIFSNGLDDSHATLSASASRRPSDRPPPSAPKGARRVDGRTVPAGQPPDAGANPSVASADVPPDGPCSRCGGRVLTWSDGRRICTGCHLPVQAHEPDGAEPRAGHA